MITVLSRYEYNPVVLSDGAVTASRKTVSNVTVFLYTLRYGDTLESLAAKLYGDSAQWWRLADVNPHIAFPLDMSPGTEIRVPQ